MIFRSGVFSRRLGLARGPFTRHWIEGHGPLARQLPGLHAYFQHHIVERIHEASPFPSDHAIDGLSQLWWDDVAAMERAEVSSEYAACKADLAHFQGAITVLVFTGVARWQAPVQAEGEASARLMVLTHLRAGEADTQVDRTVMAQALQAAATPGLKKAFQYQAIDRAHPVSAGLPTGQAPITGWSELVFEDDASLRAWLASRQAQRFTGHHPTGELMAIYRIQRYPVLDPAPG